VRERQREKERETERGREREEWREEEFPAQKCRSIKKVLAKAV